MTPNLPDRVAAALGRAWVDDEAWAVVTELSRLDSRLGGSAGERAAASVVARAFERSGVHDVSLDSFPTQTWTRGESRLERLDSGRAFDCLALPYSPTGDVEADLVDVGHGTPREIRAAGVSGRVAVASTTTPEGGRFIHRMEKYGCAVDEGAVGFVFANRVPGQLPPTGSLRFDREAEIPAVGVSQETGAWLTDPVEAASARVRLAVEATTEAGESQNVVGTLGPASEDELLLLAHYDAHDVGEGALDNACGVAVVVAACRILAEMDLSRRVRVAAVGCEETGLVGSEHLASTLDPAAVVNVDGAGRFRDLVAMTHTSDATRAVAEAVSDRSGHPIRVKPRPHPFSDQWPFVRRGVPALQLHSDSGERGRGWGHTAADTRDKVDPRVLRDHAMLTALLVHELAGRDPPRLDVDTLQRRFRTADFEPGMRAAGLWPDEWD
ncbi:M28 family metallopeptidase [Salinigranum halophilum]|uniref:M28 family metallopeptidase n=1 Tax=Salinigranum halophilum TaxID=2565931 RepID=UPI0010A8A844|nr:M28 family metallopeptidase [Salinigranum halophilum]